VARAHDTERGFDVALKVVGPRSEAEKIERLRHEFEVLQELRGVPGLVNALGYIEGSGTDPHVLVLEYLRGETLWDRAHQPITDADLPTAMGWFDSAARTLRMMHERGFVHRDLKPENIFVEPSGRVRLIDLGSSGRGRGLGKGRLTEMHGNAPGTPAYLSPRCARGMQAVEEDDVYALVMSFAEYLGGVHPLLLDAEEDDPLGDEWRRRQIELERPRLADLRPELTIPETLDALVGRGISKDAARQFRDAEELVTSLTNVIETWHETPRSQPGQPDGPRLTAVSAGAGPTVDSPAASDAEAPEGGEIPSPPVPTGPSSLSRPAIAGTAFGGLAAVAGAVALLTIGDTPEIVPRPGDEVTAYGTAFPLLPFVGAHLEPTESSVHAYATPLLVPHALEAERCDAGALPDCDGGRRWYQVRDPHDGDPGWVDASLVARLPHRHVLVPFPRGNLDHIEAYCDRSSIVGALSGDGSSSCASIPMRASDASGLLPLPVRSIEPAPSGSAPLYRVLIASPQQLSPPSPRADAAIAAHAPDLAIGPRDLVARDVWIRTSPELYDAVLLTPEEAGAAMVKLTGIGRQAAVTSDCPSVAREILETTRALLQPGDTEVAEGLWRHWSQRVHDGVSILLFESDLDEMGAAECDDLAERVDSLARHVERSLEGHPDRPMVVVPFSKLP